MKTPNKKNKHDTPFKQQTLKTWNPILSDRIMILSSLITGIVCLSIGIVLFMTSKTTFEKSIQYNNLEICGLTKSQKSYGTECKVNITLDQDVELPLYVYYKLVNFYQNHRRYVKSRSEEQLAGKSTVSDCEPLKKGVNDKNLYPCGLIAHSYFSDQIIAFLVPFDNKSEEISFVPGLVGYQYPDDIPSWKKKGIAWESDRNEKFKLLPRFDDFDPPESYAETFEFNSQWTRVGPEQKKINDYLGITNYSSDNAIKIPLPNDEDLIVWMRTSASSTFNKLYRQIEDIGDLYKNRTHFMKGDTIIFKIRNFFDVSDFNGEKYIVITTTNYFGSTNNFLTILFITLGSFSIILSLFIVGKHIICPRKIGSLKASKRF